MNDLIVFILLFLAIAIGWLLGRRAGGAKVAAPELPSEYYKGLNYLLDGRPDGAVDAFIDALEVNSETLETHIALGNLLRKKGEVDRAIRIHQNLLARPSLPRGQVHQAHLELARDYISAGLLDRAERLLLDLVEESPAQRQTSRHHLLEIYQSERDWQRAIAIASALMPRKSLLGGSSADSRLDDGPQIAVALSHYHCEMAQEAMEQRELTTAQELLQQALNHDKQCVRASIMLGEIEYKAGRYKQGVRALRRVKMQDSAFIPETIATLRLCYRELGDEPALRAYLEECVSENPSPALVLAVAEDVCRSEGNNAAGSFLSGQLAKRPSLRGLAQLISLQMDDTDGPARDNLGLLQMLVNRLVAERPVYRCGHCGFAGQNLHWFCPGCKCWGTMKTTRGGSGE